MFKRQSYLVNGIQHFFGGMAVEAVGGGWGLVDFLFRSAERNGITVRYNTGLRKLIQNRKGEVTGVTVFGPDGYEDISAEVGGARLRRLRGRSRRCACATTGRAGRWRACAARGTTPATASRRRWRSARRRSAAGRRCHAVQWDLSAPPFGDRVVLDNYQKHSYPIGIIVNADGERFVDEGADFRNYTYAKYGREVMKQPQRMAVQIFDKKTIDMTARRVPHPPGDQGRGEHARGTGAEAGDQPRRPGAHGARSSTRRASRASTIRRSSTARAPRASRRPSPTGRCRSTSRRSTASR